MNRKKSPFKNALILCFSVFFSVQTHGAGKWREKISRHLPFTTTYKLKKWEKSENQRRKQLSKRVNSMSDRELVVLDLELKNESHDIDTIKEMKALARKEIYTRISQNEQDEVFQILAPALKMRLSSILNDEKMAPHFFEVFQDAARGNPPRAYRNILKEFFLAHADEIMALRPTPTEIGILSRAIYSVDVSMRILQETLDETESADTFLATFDAVAIPAPNKKNKEALKHFFDLNSEKLGKLLSQEQADLMHTYINRDSVDNAKRAIIKIRSETPNARNAWKYLRDIVDYMPNYYQLQNVIHYMRVKHRMDKDLQRYKAELFINFLKTWPQYLNLVDEKTGDNLLHMVAHHGREEITSKDIGAFLVEAGLKLEAKNKAGETALFIIGTRDIFSPLFDYLKEKGANVNATDFNGDTILHAMTDRSRFYIPNVEKAIEEAIDSGISPYQKNHKGESFLTLVKRRYSSNEIEGIKELWRQYVEENSEVPVSDSDLALIGREGEQKVSKASRCRRLFSVLSRRKEVKVVVENDQFGPIDPTLKI